MKHIFVSYAREDKKFARQLTSGLREWGKKPWQDLRDIRGGDDNWQALIDNALRNAEALVVVMSPHAAKSQYVTYEWAYALGAGIRVIPVVKKPTLLHPRLGQIQCVDFTTRRGTPWLDLRGALPRRIRKRRSATGPQIRAKFNLIDGKPEKRGNYYGIDISLHRPPRAVDQVTYEFHDETLKRGRWPSKAASANFESFILSNGDSLLAASIRIPGKDTLRITSSLYKALRRGHGSNPRPEIANALREIRKSTKS